ncbi:transcriptional activator RfaH [Thioclava marina]|uniref:Transcription termination/antitermination protein NusG n=1 Tax=Thioclava marina TaxID=1915077 RepID=A0ABX3MKZ6_9RHOB|nr:transcriptional activator RfaH [Thioclava marina]
MITETPWFLAQLKPNSAAIAQTHLERQGFTTFLPREVRTIRRAGRFERARRPLFPGYLFVSFDPARGLWRKINATRGVSRLVSFGAEPRQVPSGLISELVAQCDTEACLQSEASFSAGDTVRVASGPFTDLVGRIAEIDPDARIWVLLDFMGGERRIAVDPKALRSV